MREVYTPFYGSYRRTEGLPWESSSLLGRLTLSHCFTWVSLACAMCLARGKRQPSRPTPCTSPRTHTHPPFSSISSPLHLWPATLSQLPTNTLRPPPFAARTTAKHTCKIRLASCQVGIVEEMALSLALLKAELPSFFRNLDTTHLRMQWSPASSSTRSEAAGNASHPFLRSQVLANDYSLYDAERARLVRRAQKAGITIVVTQENLGV